MKIKVLGTGCMKCKKLYAEAEKAIAASGVPVPVRCQNRIQRNTWGRQALHGAPQRTSDPIACFGGAASPPRHRRAYRALPPRAPPSGPRQPTDHGASTSRDAGQR